MGHFPTFAADEVVRAKSVFGYATISSRRDPAPSAFSSVAPRLPFPNDIAAYAQGGAKSAFG